MTNNLTLAAVMALAAASCLVLSLWVLRSRGVPGARAFGLMMMAAAVWAAASGFEAGLGELAWKTGAAKISYIGTLTVPFFWLIFASQYSGRDRWLTGRNLALFFLAPLIAFLLVATTEHHGLIWTSTSFDLATGTVVYGHGYLFWVTAVAGYCVMVVGQAYIIAAAVTSRSIYRLQAGVIAAAVAFTWLANLVYLLGLSPWPGVDPAPVVMTASGGLIAWALIGLGLFQIIPVARESLLENLVDGVLVFDINGQLADVNPAAQHMLGTQVSGALGKPSAEVLAPWPILAELAQQPQAGRHEGQLESAEPEGARPDEAEPERRFRQVEISLSPVMTPRGQQSGWLMVLHDVTKRSLAEAALKESQAQLLLDIEERRRLEAENVQLLEAARRRAEEAETLRQAGAAVAASLRLDESIDRILEELERVVPYDRASVQLLRNGSFEIVGGRGFSREETILGRVYSVRTEGPAREVFERRRPVLVSDSLVGSTALLGQESSGPRSWLGVPLVVHDRLMGMMALDGREPGRFTSDHARLAEAFADQVSVALENARLYEEAERLAITDSLTGLHNRRFLFEEGERELERARRYPPKSLCCLMIDIDKFKFFNDTYGHAVGDFILRELAQCLRKESRQVDLVARYGGEEFLILLPETSLEGGRMTAERLRQAVERVALSEDTQSGVSGLLLPPITVSIGVAALTPDSTTSLDLLLGRCDLALYRAKQAGRNRVCVFEDFTAEPAPAP